jgi:MSHA biogenesis protein MshJ
MKAQWQRMAEKLDALTLRERMLVLVALVAVIGGGWMYVVLEPWQAEQVALAKEIAAVEQQIAASKEQAQAVLARAQRDPNEVLRAREAQLQGEIERLDRELQARAGDFVAPADMAQALRDLLAVQGGLRLVRLQTVAPVPLQAEGPGTMTVPVYRHGLELEFVGDYVSTLAFLEAVERLPWRFFWDELDYQVERHPTARVRLRIHTLSGQEAWIGV